MIGAGWRPRGVLRSAVVVAASLVALGTGARPVAADDPVLVVDWSTSAPLSGEVVDGAAHVTGVPGGGRFPLATIAAPDLGTIGYTVRGDVRYRDVAGDAYLEMWSVFADGSRYFTRTLATEGPLARLTGTSDWRPFELPFQLNGTTGLTSLEIGLVLPGEGTVDVGALTLVRSDGSAAGLAASPTLGLLGAVCGVTIGLLGALIGWLVARRRARTFVLGAMAVISGVGVVFLVAGLAAAVAGQPWSVVTLLVLPGVIMAAVFGALRPTARRAYADAELRRMRAIDAP